MEKIPEQIRQESIRSFQSTIRKLERSLEGMNRKGANTTLADKRLKALQIGLAVLEMLWGRSRQASDADALLEDRGELADARKILEGLLPYIERMASRARSGSPQKTLLERRLTSLKLSIQAMDELTPRPEINSSVEMPVPDDLKRRLTISRPDGSDRAGAAAVFDETIRDAFVREVLGHLGAAISAEIAAKMKLLDQSLGEQTAQRFLLVARLGDQVIGTIAYGPPGPAITECTGDALNGLGEIGSLCVLPRFQDRGVGSALIRAMAEDLSASGVERFCLDSGYKRAQRRWLQKFGQPFQVVPDYWGAGQAHMIWVGRTQDLLG